MSVEYVEGGQIPAEGAVASGIPCLRRRRQTVDRLLEPLAERLKQLQTPVLYWRVHGGGHSAFHRPSAWGTWMEKLCALVEAARVCGSTLRLPRPLAPVVVLVSWWGMAEYDGSILGEMYGLSKIRVAGHSFPSIRMSSRGRVRPSSVA